MNLQTTPALPAPVIPRCAWTGSDRVPFSRDQLRQDILQILWHHLRTTTLFADEAQVRPLAGKPLPEWFSFWQLDREAAEFEVGFPQVANTIFGRCLEMQFDFGYRGVLTNQAAAMELDSDHTWVALYLHDLMTSDVVNEVEAWSTNDLKAAIKRCYGVSKMANARLALEDREIFSYFSSPKSGDRDDSAPLDGLTIRQVAMLAGMEEMSVRTAVNCKGPNHLPTYKDDGRTLVRSEDAKTWLKAKGKYVPITREWSGQQLRLEKTKFASLYELDGALQQQILHLSGVAGTMPDELRSRLRAVYEAHGHGDVFGAMTYDQAKDAKLMAAVAEALFLPPQLLILRAQQAQLSDELQQLDREISRLEPTSTPPAASIAAN